MMETTNEPERPDHADEIQEMVAEQFMDEALSLVGAVAPADVKARAAARAERIEQMDAARGMAPAKYAEFREAFDAGADCAELFEIRNRMEPKDPLKVAANEDLRSVGCYMAKSRRRS